MTLRPASQLCFLECTSPKNPPCWGSIDTVLLVPPAIAVLANTATPHTATATTIAKGFLAFNSHLVSSLLEVTLSNQARSQGCRPRFENDNGPDRGGCHRPGPLFETR